MFRCFCVKKANKIDEHVIIEANAGVIKRGEQWAKDQPNKVFGNVWFHQICIKIFKIPITMAVLEPKFMFVKVTFIHGLWQDAIDKVEDNSLDGLKKPNPHNKKHRSFIKHHVFDA